MIFASVQVKGGVGKTLVACHAALWLYELGRRVAVVDADTQRATCRWLREAQPEIPVDAVNEPDKLHRRLPDLGKAYEVVVVDGAPGLNAALRTVLLLADRAVVPVTPSLPDVLAARQTVELIRSVAELRDRPLDAYMLLNRAQRGRRLTREAGEAIVELGLPVAQQALFLRAAFQDSFGSAVWRNGSRAGAAAREMHRLLSGILIGV